MLGEKLEIITCMPNGMPIDGQLMNPARFTPQIHIPSLAVRVKGPRQKKAT